MSELIAVQDAAGFPRTDEGYRVLSVTAVGLPIWKVNLNCRLLQRKKVSVFPEFALKAIDVDLRKPQEIATFLSLPMNVVLDVIAELFQAGHVVPVREYSESPSFNLTKSGRALVDELVEVRPVQRDVVFHLDALSNTYHRFTRAELFNASQAETAGLLLVQTRSTKPPRIGNSEAAALERAYLSRPLDDSLEFLGALKQDDEVERLYLPAMLVVTESFDTEGLGARIFIDSRFSEEHTFGYLREQLLDRAHVKKGLDVDLSALARVASDVSASDIRDEPRLDSVFEQLSRASRRVQKPTSLGSDRPEPSDTKSREMLAAVTAAESLLYTNGSRWAHAAEHDLLLARAAREAKSRLLLVLPRLSANYWSEHLAALVSSCVESGVDVTVLLPESTGRSSGLQATELADITRELTDAGCEVRSSAPSDPFVLAVDESWCSFSVQSWGHPFGFGSPRVSLGRSIYIRDRQPVARVWARFTGSSIADQSAIPLV